MKISAVIPVYRCKACIPELYHRLIKVLEVISSDFEIIFIDDASPDDPWSIIRALCEKDNCVKAIRLSRNFGQHYAITAGLVHATGEWIIVMDCDLQDKPEEIKKLYAKACEGYDIVLAQRIMRKDNVFRKLFSFIFYRLLGYLTNTRQDHTIANFGIYRKPVIESVLKMKDSIRYLPAMIRWVGFRTAVVKVDHGERPAGRSAYNTKKLLKLGMDVVLSFSEKPIVLVAKLGFLISAISFLSGIFFLIQFFRGRIEVMGYTSLIISVWFLSGVIIFILGIIGLYLGKTFDKVKERPLFIIESKLNL